MSTLLHSGQRFNSFENEWHATVNPTVTALLKAQPVSQRQWQDLFMSIYNLYSWIDQGADKIRKALKQELKKDVELSLKEMNRARDDHDFLTIYEREWTRFFNMTEYLPLAFKIVDGDNNKNSANYPCQPPREDQNGEKTETCREMMLETWMSSIFEDVYNRLLKISEKLIEIERSSVAPDPNNTKLIVGVRNSFYYLCEKEINQEMRKKYEKSYVENAIAFYSNQSTDCMMASGVRGYLDYADQKIGDEQRRARQYLSTSTEADNALTEGLVKAIICTFEGQILALCPQLITEHNYELLAKMYRLIKMTPEGLTSVEVDLQKYIREEGIHDMKANVNTITSDPEKYVTQLLKMFEKYSNLVAQGFKNDPRLLTARDKAFREVVNDISVFNLDMQQNRGKTRTIPVESKCPELLANFCDLILRRGNFSKKMRSEDIDARLEEVLLVLKYVDNKDVFMRFYRSHLSRRLILDISSDRDKEDLMVTRLREKGMPHEHIHKLSRMLQDIDVNKTTNMSFKVHLEEKEDPMASPSLINLKVLNSFAWGRGGGDPTTPITLPRELEEYTTEAEKFYKGLHASRRLAWMHHWAFGVLNFVTNEKNSYDLEVTTAQMCVFLQLNDRTLPGMTMDQLRTQTALPDTELKRTLQSLVSNPRLKDDQLLNCDHGKNPKDWTDSSKFTINFNFRLTKNGQLQPRGKINLIGQLRLVLEPKSGDEYKDITALRECRVQEAIVKIMKSRKKISSANLQSEVIELLKGLFLPHKQLIKSQIDWLLENGLIERSQDDMNSFTYIA